MKIIDQRDRTRELTRAERGRWMSQSAARERVQANRQIEGLGQNDRIIELLEVIAGQQAEIVRLLSASSSR